MTKFSVEEVSSVERCIHVELAPEEVQGAIEQAYRRINASVSIPGFRKGKAPRRRLEALYKGRAIADALESLLQASYEEVLSKTPDLQPITMPRVVPEEFKEGAPFSYKATVEVRPTIALSSLEGLQLHKHSAEVTDEMIDKVIERVRLSLAKEDSVEGREVAEAGDIAVVDFSGTIDGKPFEGGVEKDARVELVAGDFMREGRTDALVGQKIGETREIAYTFLKEHLGEEHALADKTANLSITLKALKTRHLPDVDDALAKASNLGDTVDAMRQKLHRDMSAQVKSDVARHTREQLLKGLRERNPIQVPASMVENMARRIFHDLKERMAQQGIPVSDKMTLDNSPMAAQLRERAEQDVRDALLLDAVATQEKLDISDADLEEKLKVMAEESNLPIELLRGYMMSPNSKPAFIAQLREEKALALLESKAALVDACEHDHD